MNEPASTKPYLLRAIHEWCVNSGYTPYISVVVDSQTRVPMEYVRDGEIVLNLGSLATSRLQMGNQTIEFTARFSGIARELVIPVSAVSAIYARENGHGMAFEAGGKAWESAGEVPATPADVPEPPRPGGKPTLRRIK